MSKVVFAMSVTLYIFPFELILTASRTAHAISPISHGLR